MSALRAAGAHRAEAFVFWVGNRNGTTFTVTDAYVPAQDAYHTSDGHCVIVKGDALHQLNEWLYTNRRELIAQIHSHPTEAYHSETDDEYPIATRLGSLSLVVPDFAEDDFVLDSVAAYRLTIDGWEELHPEQKQNLFEVTG
jgi:hypothetical protein